MTIYHFNDMDAQMRGLCDAVRGELAGALAVRGRAVLAVPGGRTPAPFFEMLAGCGDLDWRNIVVLLTDERCVADDSPRSNGRLLRASLLQNHAAVAQYLPIYDHAGGDSGGGLPESVTESVMESVAGVLPLDVCVVGMGADAHTASLFADSPELAVALAEDAPPLVRVSTPSMGEDRVTLSAGALRSASAVHILISGADKYTTLQAAMAEGEISDAPIRAILHGHQRWDVYFKE